MSSRVVKVVRENKRAKALELQRQWEELLAKHAAPLERGAKAKGVKTTKLQTKKLEVAPIVRGNANHIPSLQTPGGDATKPEPKKYTGTKIVGIATMHKSNMVPIFNEQEAVDVATMRRN